MMRFDEDTFIKLVLGILVGLLVFGITVLICRAYEFDQMRMKPSGYSDTVKLVIDDIQLAKAHWAKVGDQEKYQYWADMESSMMDKMLLDGEKSVRIREVSK